MNNLQESKDQLNRIITRFLEGKAFILVLALLTFGCWLGNSCYIPMILIGIFTGVLAIFNAKSTSYIGLYMLLTCGRQDPTFGANKPALVTMIITLSIGGLLYLYRMIENRKILLYRVKRNSSLYTTLLLLLIMLISLVNTPTMGKSIYLIFVFACTISVIFIVSHGLENDSHTKDILCFSLIILAYLTCLEATYKIVDLHNTENIRYIDLLRYKAVHLGWMMSNHYTVFISIGAIVSLYYIFKSNNFYKIVFYSGSTIAFLTFVALLICRGAYLGLLIALPIEFIYLIITNRKKWKTILIACSAGIAALLFVVLFLHHFNQLDRVLDLLKTRDSNLNGREKVYDVALKHWREHPIIGTGYGTAQYYLQKDLTGWNLYNYHNYFYQILSTCGIIGAIAFAIYLADALVKNNNKDYITILFYFITLYCLGHGLVDTVFFGRMIMLLYAILYAYIKQIKQPNIRTNIKGELELF